MPAALQRKLLERAMEIAGGRAALSARLGIDEHSLVLWLEEKAQIPRRAFLAVADVILEDDVARAAQDRRLRPRATDDATDSPSARSACAELRDGTRR